MQLKISDRASRRQPARKSPADRNIAQPGALQTSLLQRGKTVSNVMSILACPRIALSSETAPGKREQQILRHHPISVIQQPRATSLAVRSPGFESARAAIVMK